MAELPNYGNDAYKRVSDLMDAGNNARKLSNDNSILALGAASEIFAKRKKNEDKSSVPSPKTCYIIESLKHPDEVAQLRRIYPSGFLLVGVHSNGKRRLNKLIDRGMSQENAEDLIRRDGEEARILHGQRVNKTFHMSDFFVEVSPILDQLESDIKRIIDLWFGNPYITPTFDEHAMFMAYAAALRSADMSRQVGAVITRNSQILSTGANDCPKAGGGLYWPERNPNTHCVEDLPNGRDYLRDCGDSNRAEQIQIVNKIIDAGLKSEFGFDEIKLRKLLNSSPLRDLTEYGRVVHAEMEALLSCSRNGLSTVGSTIYCTTFPCHNCAKHIIAAGTVRVVYVEPYAKSKALDFHDDSILHSEDKLTNGDNRVRFDPFVGIGPRRFFDLFSMQLSGSYELIRKNDDGKRVDWRINGSKLRIQMQPTSYLEHEALACSEFGQAVERIRQISGA